MNFTPRSVCSSSREAYEQQMLQESTSAKDNGRFLWATDVSACEIHRQLIEMHDNDVLRVQHLRKRRRECENAATSAMAIASVVPAGE
jgi:hypothetical protein